MNDVKLIEELERKIQFHQEQFRRYKEALFALRGKSKGRRRSTLRAGKIPARIAALLKDGPLLPAEIAEGLARVGQNIGVRAISIALARYVRARRFFRREEDGRYALLE